MENFDQSIRSVLEVFHGQYDTTSSYRFNTAKLIQAISRVTGYAITQVELSEKDMPDLRGMLLTYENHSFGKLLDRLEHLNLHINPDCKTAESTALILVARSERNNECWRRFTVIKEASHLLFEADDLKDHSDPELLATSLSNIGNFEELTPEQKELADREVLGIKAAIKLFLPETSHREWMTHKVNVEKQSPFQIASTLMLPQIYIEYVMRQWELL